jgi:hypothetical protein
MTEVFLLVCMGLAAVIAGQLLSALKDIEQLRRRSQELAGKPAVSNPFDGRSRLTTLANAYVTDLNTSVKARALASFDPDRRIGPVSGQVRAFTTTPRALIGVLILAGLLVTLFNIQGSVRELGEAFDQLSRPEQGQRTEFLVARIQGSMRNVANAAHNAFYWSGLIILFAATSLALAAGVQWRGQVAVAAFGLWARAAYYEASAAAQPADQQASLEKLAGVVGHLNGLVSPFQDLSKSMNAVVGFGDRLDESTRLIAEAVEKLPEGVKASVVSLSGEVAREIAEDLQHQLEHIQKILYIYGAQEIRMKELQEGFKKIVSLPGDISKLTNAIAGTTANSAVLNRSVESLDRKVDALPILDMQETVEHARIAFHGLEAVREQVGRASLHFQMLVDNWRSETRAVISEELGLQLDEIRTGFAAVRDALERRDTSGMQSELSKVERRVAEMRDRLGTLAKDRTVVEGFAAFQEQVASLRAAMDASLLNRLVGRLRGRKHVAG